jgi:hypothetical protein
MSPPAAVLPAEAPAIKMQIINPGKVPAIDLLAKLNGVVATEDPGAAVLTWDVRRGHLLNKLGDIVAYANAWGVTVPPPAETRGFARTPPPTPALAAVAPPPANDGLADIENIQKVVDKWRVVEEVRQYALQEGLTIALKPGDSLYRQSDKVTLSVSGQRYTYFTLFNIGSDGTINFLYPLTDNQYNDPLEMPIGRSYQIDLTVQSPFGSDHFIAIASNEPLRELHRDLATLDGKQSAREVPAVLKRDIEGKTWQVGVHGVYTAPMP